MRLDLRSNGPELPNCLIEKHTERAEPLANPSWRFAYKGCWILIRWSKCLNWRGLEKGQMKIGIGTIKIAMMEGRFCATPAGLPGVFNVSMIGNSILVPFPIRRSGGFHKKIELPII